MSPDTDPDTGMPGIRDFEVTLPFTRDDGDTRQETEMRVRIPSHDADTAAKIGFAIGQDIDYHNTPGGHRWEFDRRNPLTVTDVDAEPSPAELAAEVQHWRRVVTALVANLPLLTTVKPEQYAAADPAKLTVVPAPDGGMMFTTVPGLALAVTQQQTSSPREPVGPDDNVPILPVGMIDPDVRKIKTHGLSSYAPTTVDLVHDGEWMHLLHLAVTPDLTIKVHLEPVEDGEPCEHTFTDLDAPLIVRPAAHPAHGFNLTEAARTGQQVLTFRGWRTVLAVDYTGGESDAYKTTIACDDDPDQPNYITSHLPHDLVLLRNQPPGWWTK